jgi:hypothetical protein
MRKNLVEYSEEAETRQEYKGYFCSIPEAMLAEERKGSTVSF